MGTHIAAQVNIYLFGLIALQFASPEVVGTIPLDPPATEQVPTDGVGSPDPPTPNI